MARRPARVLLRKIPGAKTPRGKRFSGLFNVAASSANHHGIDCCPLLNLMRSRLPTRASKSQASADLLGRHPAHRDHLGPARVSGNEGQGGAWDAEAGSEKPQQGRVLSVGDGALLPDGKRSPLTVQEGDRVVFHAYAGTEVKIADQDLLICREDDILAIMD